MLSKPPSILMTTLTFSSIVMDTGSDGGIAAGPDDGPAPGPRATTSVSTISPWVPQLQCSFIFYGNSQMYKALSITDMSPIGNILCIDEGLLVSLATHLLHLSKSNLQAQSSHTLETKPMHNTMQEMSFTSARRESRKSLAFLALPSCMPLEGWRAPLGSVVLLNSEGSGLHATLHTSKGPANLKVNLRCSTAAKSRLAAKKWMKVRPVFVCNEIIQ